MPIRIRYGTTDMHANKIYEYMREPCIITRMTHCPLTISDEDPFVHDAGLLVHKEIYDKYLAGLKRLHNHDNQSSQQYIGILTAGTSDSFLAKQCEIYLMAEGHFVKLYDDMGVNENKIMSQFDDLNKNAVNIVIAGMEAVLYPVVADNTTRPVLFVPSNVGYGYGHGGEAALLSGIQSNSVGAIFNIENIWGACTCAMLLVDILKSGSEEQALFLQEPQSLNCFDEYPNKIIVTEVQSNGHFPNVVAASNKNALVVTRINSQILLNEQKLNNVVKSVLNNCILNICLSMKPDEFCSRIRAKSSAIITPATKPVTTEKNLMMTNDEFFKVTSRNTESLDKLVEANKKTIKELIEDQSKSKSKGNSLLMESIDRIMDSIEQVIDYLIVSVKNVLYDNLHIELARIKLMTLYNFKFGQRDYHRGIVNEESYKSYHQGILAIASVLELFDIIERQNNPNLGVYYHFLNYSYYLHNILRYATEDSDEDHFVVPILFDISATSIIKMRTKKLYFCGISTKTKYVDEFLQSPLEFFIHDINHSRRMIQNHKEKKNYDETFEKRILDFIKLKSPGRDGEHLNKDEPENIKAIRQLVKMLLFEIGHEDALDLTTETVWNAIHRSDDYTYRFEKMTIDNITGDLKVVPQDIIVEGSLSYTRYKLQYQFYDDGTNDLIVIPKYRTAKYIALAAIIICTLIREVETNRGLATGHTIKDYKYYLDKASQSTNIPRPVHKFKVSGLENDPSLTRPNDWSKGYRRVVGEHDTFKNSEEEKAHNLSEQIQTEQGSANLEQGSATQGLEQDYNEFKEIFTYLKLVIK
jgi:hypothetical protein